MEVEREALYKQFLNKFPIEKLKNLPLEEYTGTGGNTRDDFTYWVEIKTDALGGISVYSSHYGIYEFNNKPNETSNQSDDEYSWKKELGTTRHEAWEKVRALIYQIAEYSSNGEFSKIDEIELGSQYKWKVAFLYSDKKITNIFKKETLEYLLNDIGEDVKPDISFSELTVAVREKCLKSSSDYWNEASALWMKWVEHEQTKKDFNQETLLNIKKELDLKSCDTDLQYVDIEGNIDFFHNKSNLFFWIGTPDLKIGTDTCHYEVIIYKDQIRSMIHFENKTNKEKLIKVAKHQLGLKKPKYCKEAWYDKGDAVPLNGNDSDSITTQVIRNLIELDESVRQPIINALGEIQMNEYTSTYTTLLKNTKNLILTGAPGTGKTFLAKNIAAELMFSKSYDSLEEEERTQIGFVQFHPSFDYTDFVEGLRPVKSEDGQIGFERKDGVFKAFCKQAIASPDQNHVFIIDEINRGEVSKIFGELFYSIDPGYRGEEGKIQTQYQNLVDRDDEFAKGFYIPENVYVIGTMNDIDRSVESIDFAFRRRFAWREIKATDNQENILAKVENSLQSKAKSAMDAINEKISNIEGLSSAYHIGASYFLKLNEYKDEEKPLELLWEYNLSPLLHEYLRGYDAAEETLKLLSEAYVNKTGTSIGDLD